MGEREARRGRGREVRREMQNTGGSNSHVLSSSKRSKGGSKEEKEGEGR